MTVPNYSLEFADVSDKVKNLLVNFPISANQTHGGLTEALPKPQAMQTPPSGDKDLNLITWDGPGDPANPKNWSLRNKWAITVMVSAYTFISPVTASIMAPALGSIGADLEIESLFVLSLTLSIFVLAYAFGPFIVGPLSEIYGRVTVLQLSTLIFLAFNIGCGFAQTKGQLIAFRFLAGLGGSAPFATGGGVLADCWTAEQRGMSISIYTLAPLLGPAVGPIMGGFITQHTTWRWVFWSTSIASGIVQVLGFIFFRETYAPKILADKARRLRKTTGNPALHTKWQTPERTFLKIFGAAIVRPILLLGTQPIIQVLSLYMAYLYGLMYLVLTTFPVLWTTTYHQSIAIGGLNYISLGLGFLIGTQSCAHLNDTIYRRLKHRSDDPSKGRPEYRLPLLIPAAILVPLGLFWYGWSAQRHLHWIMPNIGAAIFAAGVKIGFQCTQTYVVDAYTLYIASAGAAATFLRSLAGFGFPLFAPYLYRQLGYGWGNSLLAFVAIALGLPAPLLLWRWGPELRARSTYAAGDAE